MYVQEIAIKNLRVFEAASLGLQYPGRSDVGKLHHPNVNLLLGNNGAGKTTVLKALALATLAPVIDKSGFLPYELVRHRRDRATVNAKVILHPQDLDKGSSELQEQTLKAEIVRQGDLEILASGFQAEANMGPWSKMFDNSSPAFLVVGYGATRRVHDASSFDPEEQSKRRFLRYQRVAGLFESHVALTPLTAWLPKYEKENPGRHKQVHNLINKLLPKNVRFSGLREKGTSGDYLFGMNKAKVPFGALSDGYRAYIGWITDLLYHVCTGCPNNTKLVDSRGLVLVDEIDLNLHPEWQRTVCATISSALPNLQFVLTTHSPIVAGSLEKENIFVMETAPSGASIVKQYSERIYGLDADQILLSSYFGLETTRAPGYVDELQKLSQQATPGKPEAALSVMLKLSGQAEPTPAAKTSTKATARKVSKTASRKRPTKRSV